jgi:hypothetical protein
MYISLIKQNKRSKEATDWTGDWGDRNFKRPEDPLDAAEAVRSYHQFNEGYEPHGWIASNITEEEFNKLYNEGQRVFWLENQYEWMTVWLVDNPPDYLKQQEDLKKLKDWKEALDNLYTEACNYLSGYLTNKGFTDYLNIHHGLIYDHHGLIYDEDFDKYNKDLTDFYDKSKEYFTDKGQEDANKLCHPETPSTTLP